MDRQRCGSFDYDHCMPPKFACFHCRKCWKKQSSVCPQCGGVLHSIGIHFKAPRRKDIKAWKVVEELYRAGVRFDYESHYDYRYTAYDQVRKWKSRLTYGYSYQDRLELAQAVSNRYATRYVKNLSSNQWPDSRPTSRQELPAFLERWKTKTLHRISLIVAAADEAGVPAPEGANGFVMLENLAKRKQEHSLRKKK